MFSNCIMWQLSRESACEKIMIIKIWHLRQHCILHWFTVELLKSRHPTTPYNRQFLRSQLYASNTQQPQFNRHSSTFSARLSTIAAVINRHWISAVTHSTSLYLALPASIQQSKALKTRPHCTQQPDYTLLCLLEIYRKPLSSGHLAITDKMLGPNGVRYRGVPLYSL